MQVLKKRALLQIIINDDRWEIVAKKKHFITINFQEFSLQDQNQCGTGFLELR